MAKKKSNESNSSSSQTIVAILIILIIGAGVFYGLKRQGSPQSNPVSTTSKPQKEYSTPTNNQKKKTPVKKVSKKESSNHSKSESLEGKREERETNEDLPSYSNENNYYFTSSFDFVWPTYSSDDIIIEHDYFTLKYNEKMEQAAWVAYKLTKSNLDNARFKRKDNFRSDPYVSSGSSEIADYKGSGYDRGHLAPAADFTWDKEGLDDSFFMSNMSPQDPGFNRGIWKKLEEKVREMAQKNREIYVVTGPIFKGITKKIGGNRVGIPDQYYKVIVEFQGSDAKGIGFIMDNEKSSDPIESFAVSIDQVEKVTKLDFFPSIPDELEKTIESQFDYSSW